MRNERVMKLLEEASKEIPGTGIILIPPDEGVGIMTNLSFIEDGTMVMQHIAAIVHLLQNEELYNLVLDSFEKKGRDFKVITTN